MIRLFVTILFVLGYGNVTSYAQYYIEKHYQNHQFNGNQLLITTDGGLIEIEAWSESVIKIGYHFDYKPDLAPTPSVISNPKTVLASISETDTAINYETDSMSVIIHKHPLMMEYYRNGRLLTKDTLFGFFYYDRLSYHGIKLALKSNEKIYGCGSQAQDINRRFFSRTFSQTNRWGYEWDYPYNLNFAVPFFISSNNYGMYFDSYSRGMLDIDESNENVFSYNAIHSKFLFFLISGNEFNDIYREYTHLTGRQPLPPRWSLGYLQSKAYYFNKEEVNKVINDMRNADFPLDAMILDATWFGSFYNVGNMTWDTSSFPNYPKMIQDYKQEGIRIIPHTVIYVSPKSTHYDYLNNSNLICTDTFKKPVYCTLQNIDSFLLYDLTNPATLIWFWDLYKKRTEEGVSGWWCDSGEPEIHPVSTIHHNGKSSYVMRNFMNFLWLEMLYNGFKKDFPDMRPFFMTRSGWAGAQRFGAFPLCGDEARSWKGLKAMIPVMLGASMSGISYLHSDVGGFAPLDNITNPELYLRWFQLGAFSPIMRAHTVNPVPSEPVYYDDKIQNITRKYAHLRYAFLPYNYTMSYLNSSSGIPIIKPINYFEPHNDEIANINDEFIWGDNIIAAPIVDSVFERVVYLPEGKWIDWFTGEKFIGNNSYNIDVPLEKLPLYVRSGSIIPNADKMRNTKNYRADSLIFYYFADTAKSHSSFKMFNDDGLKPNSMESGLYEFIEISAELKQNEIVMNLDHIKTDKRWSSTDVRDIKLCIKKIPFKPGTLRLNGRHIKIESSFNLVNSDTKYAVHLENNRELWIHFAWDNDSTSIMINDVIDSINQPVENPDINIGHIVPNPFSDNMNLQYSLNISDDLIFKIYDITGKQIAESYVTHNYPGVFEFKWDGKANSGAESTPGVYFVDIKSLETNKSFTRILIKIGN